MKDKNLHFLTGTGTGSLLGLSSPPRPLTSAWTSAGGTRSLNKRFLESDKMRHAAKWSIDVTMRDRPTDRQTDIQTDVLQELLELPLATKNLIFLPIFSSEPSKQPLPPGPLALSNT